MDMHAAVKTGRDNIGKRLGAYTLIKIIVFYAVTARSTPERMLAKAGLVSAR